VIFTPNIIIIIIIIINKHSGTHSHIGRDQSQTFLSNNHLCLCSTIATHTLTPWRQFPMATSTTSSSSVAALPATQ
jgi:hypothetical protein